MAFGRRGGALLIGLTSGAVLLTGVAVAAPAGVLPVSWAPVLSAATLAGPTTPAGPPTSAGPTTSAGPAPAGPASTTRFVVELETIPTLPAPSGAPADPTTAPPPEPTAEPDATVDRTVDPTVDPGTGRPADPTTAASSSSAEEPTGDPQPLRADGPVPDGPAAQVVDLTNRARAAAGCGPLEIDDRITAAAQAHSADMAANGYFAHDSQDGRTFADRLRAAGHPSPGAENIAQGQRTAAEVVAAWLDSPGHRRNIEDCALVTIGVGLAGEDFLWTQDFGR